MFTEVAAGQSPGSPATPLDGFDRLTDGRWQLGEDSYNTFEWDLQRRTLKATGFFVVGGTARRVSEIVFAYHPGEDVVKGYGVAIDMGLDFFEYDVHFEADRIVLDLQAFGPAAPPGLLRETWHFTDDDHYEWTLWASETGENWQSVMGGTYARIREPGPS